MLFPACSPDHRPHTEWSTFYRISLGLSSILESNLGCIQMVPSLTTVVFSRRFRRKSRLLQWLVFFRQFNAKRPLFVHWCTFTNFYHMYLVHHFVLRIQSTTHPKPLTWDNQSRMCGKGVGLGIFIWSRKMALFLTIFGLILAMFLTSQPYDFDAIAHIGL